MSESAPKFLPGDRVQVRKIMDGEWGLTVTVEGVTKIVERDDGGIVEWYSVLWDSDDAAGMPVRSTIRDARLRLVERPFKAPYLDLLP
jgi:hypothetical protein